MDVQITNEPEIKNAKFDAFAKTSILDQSSMEFDLVVAGGACRSFFDGKDPSDYDLFIIGSADEIRYQEYKWSIVQFIDDLGFTRIFTCPQGFLYSWKSDFGKIQLVCPKQYENYTELFSSFDFSICQAAYDGASLYYTPEFWQDNEDKKLRLTNVTYPIGTMNRIMKYKSYGFNTWDAEEDFIHAVNNGEFSDDAMYRHYID